MTTETNKNKWSTKRYVLLIAACFLSPFLLSFIAQFFHSNGLKTLYRLLETISVFLLLVGPISALVINIIGLKKNSGSKILKVIFVILLIFVALLVAPRITETLEFIVNIISDFFHEIFYVKID